MATVEVVPFEDEHAPAVARLATAVQWPSLTDPDVVTRVCTAPGAVSYVALDASHGLVGWAQALTDGELQAHLSFLAVLPDHRRRGIGMLLTVATFQATGAKRVDLVTDGAAAGFYVRLPHTRLEGYRLYPGGAEAT
ncbi:GNAT family N-acetyltransferase [Nocardioides sp. CFH 31398]|uniref:GNAT family N-acetyltransferase n=1 Tax=Nocardioides sp. CFH 31398 TaxID=2919579 RepID=UPI001F06643A|nr:GNAT family N-acetyltransferase [Nocardioides sp. CFH 31398]MCH1867173.1 GNAT family N-acetyltransferase [Nocardioides sp. CFH 31398]